MAVVLGLGNPGARYRRTRHNVGWRVVEQLAEEWKAAPADSDPQWFRAWRAAPQGRELHLVVPLGFMNLSGEALAVFGERHPLDLETLLVVSDDVYLPVGTLRLRRGGTSGGHRGLESIERAFGTTSFARLRVGVGSASSSAELGEHVLEDYQDDEAEAAEQAERLAAEAVKCWFEAGLTAAMNRFNRRSSKEETTS